MTHVPPAENAVLAPVRHAMKRGGSVAMAALLALVLALVPSSAMAANPSVEATISLTPTEELRGTGPTGIAIASDGATAYVTNYGTNNVSVIRLSDNKVTATIPVGDTPTSIVIEPNGKFAYVTNYNDPGLELSSVSRLDLDKESDNYNTVTSTITHDSLRGPVNVVFSPDGSKAYVANRVSSTIGDDTSFRISVIDTENNTVTSTIPVGWDSVNLALSSDGNRLYVSHNFDGRVSFIDLRTNTVTVPIEGLQRPQGLALVGKPGSQRLFVAVKGPPSANPAQSKISVYNANTGAPIGDVVGSTALNRPESMTLNGPQGAATKMYVANRGAGNVRIISLSNDTLDSPVLSVGSNPFEIAFAPNGRKAYVTNNGDNTVSVISIPTPLGITAASLTVASGGTVTPNFSITSGALVSPDAISGLTYTFEGTGSTNYSASATAPTAVGTYSITPSAATFSVGNDSNYDITYTAGTLTIQAQPAGSPGSGGSSSSGATTPAPIVGPVPSQQPRQPRLLPVAPNTAPVAQPVERPGLRFDPNAPVRGFVGGAPTNVTNAPSGPAGVSLSAGAFQFGLSLRGPSGNAVETETPSQSPELQIPRGQSADVSGGGSYPGSFVQLWLPGNGTDARELARIPVRSDGTFAADLTFGAGPLEMPVPIGRQVLQVVGYDERGNQTVVDMTINIGQGVPAPEPNRQAGALPALLAGQSLATSGGIPESVVVRAMPEDRIMMIDGNGWAISVNVDGSDAVTENTDGDALLRLERSTSGTAGGSGFLPGTLATVWLFSEPTLMATVTVDDAGSFSADFLVDGRLISPGEHTLQIQGVGADGFIKAANLGVVVEEPVQLTSDSASGLLYWVVGLMFVAILVGVLFVVALKRRRQVA